MDVFQELENKRVLHQHWLTKHPHYTCVTFGEKYSDVVDELYRGYVRLIKAGFKKQAFICADFLLDDDIRTFKGVDIFSLKLKAIEKRVMTSSSVDNSDQLWAFITIGFNEQTITNKKMKDVSSSISKLKYFETCYYVLEKHRENGIHHHTHFLVQFTEKQYKSKIIDWVYQTRGVREVCLGKNYVDVRGPAFASSQPYMTYALYHDYVHGKKKEDKMPFVELDREWRDKEDLNH